MKILLQLVHHGQSLEFDDATMFDTGWRGAQTCLLVHVFSPAYKVHICIATTRRSVSSEHRVYKHINCRFVH